MKRASLQFKIPKEIRDVLELDPFMWSCIMAHECEGKVQWHHAFTYAGKRINELWSLLPLCAKHHYHLTKHIETLCRVALRTRILFFKAFDEFTRKFPKSDLFYGTKV